MQRMAVVLALVLLLVAAGCTGPAYQDLKSSNSGTVGGPVPADRSVESGEAVAPGIAPTAASTDPRLIRNAAAASSPCMQRMAVVLALVLLLVAAGCTGPAYQDLKSSNSGTVGGPVPADRNVESGEAVGPGIAPTAASTDPRLIRNADLRVEVASLEPALDRVRAIAADHNGTVAGLELRAESGSQRTATVTVRVPEDRFDAALAALRAVGTVRSESVQTQDVTEEYVDLAAKRASLARQLDQYHRIMENTTGIDQVLKVEEEVERVQLELDRTEGRLRYLDSRTDFSRVTLRLEEPAPLAGGALPSITEVIGAGVQGFFAVLAGLVILVIALLPLVLVGGAAWYLYRRHRRSGA